MCIDLLDTKINVSLTGKLVIDGQRNVAGTVQSVLWPTTSATSRGWSGAMVFWTGRVFREDRRFFRKERTCCIRPELVIREGQAIETANKIQLIEIFPCLKQFS